MSVAAKDCSIMIALTATEPADPATRIAADAPETSGVGDDTDLPDSVQTDTVHCCTPCRLRLQHVAGQLAGSDRVHDQGRQQHTCIRTITIQGTELLVRVGVVDFDCKPLSKIFKHADLDSRILDHVLKPACGDELEASFKMRDA